ncbi:hypothetical protein L3049_14260 [Labilibaculum sp. DW002]|uniref:Uncharacterized protein n=1 Tax=Paralabilibaculum antarcticum TaxID=2912572 RepID=A0ABT5VV69_9BACT|nr:hypothetical protein [Labilibaculum sp. DW002]MDE5419160.1 hypothetical protein [Labilibaculum sp. DW002]
MDQEDFDKIRKIKKESKEAYKDWSREDDDELINLFFDNIPVGEMALKLKRTKGAVRARIRKMELIHIKKKASPSADSTKK